MASLNKVQLIGRLGRDPEIRSTPKGKVLAMLNLATSERWRDRDSGELKERTEWHRVVLHDKLAELAKGYLRTGSPLYVEGKLRTRKWTDKDDQERYTIEVVGAAVQLLGRKSEAETEAQPVGQPSEAAEEDDIPF